MISAFADGSAPTAETTAAAMSHHRGRIGIVSLMSTVPDADLGVKLALRANGTRRIVRPKFAACDAKIARGRKANRTCGARASYYDARPQQNLCGTHARDRATAVRGRGKSWHETACSAHPQFAAVAIGADDVARCGLCSLEYELAAPAPVIDSTYYERLAAGAFA